MDEYLYSKPKVTKFELDYLNFSERATNCLMNARIFTLEDLQNKSDADLLAITNFGQKCLDEVKQKLNQLPETIQPNYSQIQSPEIQLNELHLPDEIVKELLGKGFSSLTSIAKTTILEFVEIHRISPKVMRELINICDSKNISLSGGANLSDTIKFQEAGFTEEEIAKLTGITVNKIQMYKKYSSFLDEGLGYREMGDLLGISHESARRYCVRNFPERTNKEARKNQRMKRLELAAEETKRNRQSELRYILKLKGINYEEVLDDLRRTYLIHLTAQNFGIERDLVKELNETNEAPIDAAYIKAEREQAHSDEELLTYLKITYDVRRRVVTRGEYEIVANQNRTEKSWPSHQTYRLRFGSWLNACKAANVPSRSKREYEKIWTDEIILIELTAFVTFCRQNNKNATAAAYESWAKSREVPSLATIRNSGMGTWSEQVALAKSQIEEGKN